MKGLRHRAAAEHLSAPGIAGSAALHALVVTAFLVAGGTHGRQRLPPVYRVTLVAALGTPPAAEPAAAASAAQPQPPAPKPAAAKPAPAKPAPRSREPAVPIRPAPRPTPAVASKPAPSPSPAATASKPAPAAASNATTPAGPPGNPNGSPGGSDVATIKTEGVEFPFPGYLHNLVEAVYRRWRPPPSNALLEAEVFFLVHRDGSVTDLRFTQRSGSFAFDLEAQGSIESAARAGAFGVLPAGYGPDVLPVSFYFNPRSAR